MKVSVIISLCDNRLELFKRSLDTWERQTEKDFELVIVDDRERKDILDLCKNYKLNFQYIQIKNFLCKVPITTFTPVLTNNIGIRVSRGSVICITGPETLQYKDNIKIVSTFINRKECGYGLVYKSNKSFINTISENWNKSFDGLLNIPGAKSNCLTRPPHPPRYNYFMVVAKKYAEAIGGFDENFGQGYCGEDDDFGNRMEMCGIKPIFEHRILGIHQDHSSENTNEHIRRYTNKMLRQRNINLMYSNLKSKKIIANTDHIWGDEKVIVYREIFKGS